MSAKLFAEFYGAFSDEERAGIQEHLKALDPEAHFVAENHPGEVTFILAPSHSLRQMLCQKAVAFSHQTGTKKQIQSLAASFPEICFVNLALEDGPAAMTNADQFLLVGWGEIPLF